MTTAPEYLEVAFEGCTMTRGTVTVTDEHVFIRFDMRGPAATIRFPKDHVAVFPDGGQEKVDSLGGYGGESPGGSRFFEWQLLRHGAHTMRVVYIEDGKLLTEEHLSLTS